MHLIYGLVCTCSVECENKGIRYIGQTTKTLNDRLYGHITASRFGKRYPVYDWLRKHGESNVSIVVIKTCDSRSESDKAEIECISHLKSTGLCLNVRVGGDSMGKHRDKLKTHCPRGHLYRRNRAGKAICDECNTDRYRQNAVLGFGDCVNNCTRPAAIRHSMECRRCYKKRLRAEGVIAPKTYGACACGNVAAYKDKMQCTRCYQKQRRDSAKIKRTIGQ
jgi:hypothetical protein